MFRIADEQIDFVLDDLYAKGIRTADLQQNLLDHVCILAEQDLEEGGDFETYYQSIIPTFYRRQLIEIEEETHFLLKHRKCFAVLNRLQFFLALFTVLIGPIVCWTVATLGGPAQMVTQKMVIEAGEGGLVFALFPLLVLVVLFLTPDRFDPLIPRGAKILFGWRPFISIVPPDDGLQEAVQ